MENNNKEEKSNENNEKEEIKNVKNKNMENKDNKVEQTEEKKDEQKENNNVEINIKKEDEKEKDNQHKDQNDNKNEINDKNDENIDPHLIFQKELLNIIKKQEKILNATSTINEKFDVSNQITKEQIASFKTNIDKYGKYLLMIKKELGMISDTMKKIKKLSKEQNQ